MKIAALISGGKDSMYATYLAGRKNDIGVLLTIKPERIDSYMFHFPNVEYVKLQARAMRLPLIFKHAREDELLQMENAIREAVEGYGVEALVSGAIFSRYQKRRIDDLCRKLGLKSISPLWGRKPADLWNGMFKAGFEVIIAGVAADGLTKEWLGRIVDRKAFSELMNLHSKCYICTGGEGGEFETFVLDCPLFKEKILIQKKSIFWDERIKSGYLIIEKARLVKK
jgi:ABC transporter with metal-binding/Fe-S-binding domain ATP-binding protein